MDDPDSEYAYTYDNLGRVLTVSNSGTSGVPTVVLTSAYNANGRRTSLSVTRGGTNDFLDTFTYDNLNRLTRVEQTGNGGATVANKRADFVYNAIGQFTSIARQVKPSSTWNEVATSTFTYDTLSRITALDHKKGSTDIANYDWTYDALNRVTQLSSGDGTSDYTYDKESELTATDHSFQTDESYAYDGTGNRTNGSYSVGTNNRMTSDGTYNYTYDDEGNRLTRTKISDSSLTEYTWDHRNRLTKVVERATGSGGAITKQTDYKYDIFDRRISKSYDADGAGGGSAVVSRFVYDGNNIALQFDGSNNLTHRYLHGPAVDQILADEDASNNILWPLTDNLGTVRDLVNDSGTVQNHLKYDSFGKVTSESNSAVDHLFAYTGRERDEETGLQYHRARYYDPATGRFLSLDPSGFAALDANLARYAGNTPTNGIDSTGRAFQSAAFSYTPSPGYGMYNANDPAYRVAYQAMLAAATAGAPAMVPSQTSPAEYAAWMAAFTLSPVGAFVLWANDMTPEDIMLMGQNPVATAQGGAVGAFHGETMVWDEATFHLISPLHNYVETNIARYGGTYGMAQASASIGTSAAYALLPCGYIANAAKVMEAAANTRDIYEGYYEGNPWKMASGTIGLATAALGGWCFVAGTQVVVGENVALSSLHGTIEPSAGDRTHQWLGWSLMFVGLGLVVSQLRRRKRREDEPGSQNDTRVRLAADDPRDDDHVESVTDDVFADLAWIAPAIPGAMSPGGHRADYPSVASSRPTCSVKSSLDTSNKARRSSWTLLWLAASLLIAGLLTLGGTFLGGIAESPSEELASQAGAERWITKNIEDLKVGDQVLAWDETTGQQALKPIDRTYVRTADHLQHVTIVAADGFEQTLHTTDEHPFWVPGRAWIHAGKLIKGDSLRQPDGSTSHVVANRREPRPEGVSVFNLRVEDSHTYFAAARPRSSAVLVHNANARYDSYMKWLQEAHPEIYKMAKEAEEFYPKKVGILEDHHNMPKYVGGDASGPMTLLPAAYHQWMTNAWRKIFPYGQELEDAAMTTEEVYAKIYGEFPLPVGYPGK